MNNEEKFTHAKQQMEKERSAFLGRFQGFSQAQLDFKPSRDSWSIGEIAQHVALTEQVISENLKKLLQEAGDRQETLRKVGFDELPFAPRYVPVAVLQFPPVQLSLSLMSRFMPRPVQTFLLANPLLKARAAPDVEPKGRMTKQQVLNFLSSVRDSTIAMVEPLKSRDLSRIRWEHPLMGTHDVYGTLELLGGHDQRHRIQIDRVKGNARFPAA